MYVELKINLTDEQMKDIKNQTKIELDKALEEGKLTGYIKDVIKSQIKGIVSEEIQTKNYRKYITDKVTKTLIEEELISDTDTL